MNIIYISIIAIIVLLFLLGKKRKYVTHFVFIWGKRLLIIVVVVSIIFFVYKYFSNKIDSNNINKIQDNSISKSTDVSNDIFPMNNVSLQFSWYDKHNVAMVNRCYPSSYCSAENWAFAVYNNKNDSRGVELKNAALKAQADYIAQFPNGKCSTESDIKICDLSSVVKSTNKNNTRTVSFQANQIECINIVSGKNTESFDDSITIDNGNNYCVSDFGDLYVDPMIQIVKYYNQITRKNYNSPYMINTSYDKCVWAYDDGSGSVPSIEVLNNIGPDSGFDTKAYCKNGNNQIDIYTFNN